MKIKGENSDGTEKIEEGLSFFFFVTDIKRVTVSSGNLASFFMFDVIIIIFSSGLSIRTR